MPRCQRVVLFLLSLATLPAAILPEGFEQHARQEVIPLKPEPVAVWHEFGLQEAEKADYTGAKGRFTVSAWRVADATAAQAAWQLLRPADAKPSDVTKLAAVSGNRLLLAVGNYVVQFEGFTPQVETLNQLILHMPRFDSSSLPVLTGFLPTEQRMTNSERYIVGPASLAQFAPGIPPSVAAFHFGTEAQTGRFRDKDGEVELVIFSYPNHQIAKERMPAFEGVKGLVSKRSGPLVAVVTRTPSADAAERVLSLVRYEANVTLNQKMRAPKDDNIGVLVLGAAKLAGFVILFCLLAGFGFAGFRQLSRKMSGQKGSNLEEVIGLHITE